MGEAPLPLLVVLTGPTGTGKSELAGQVAERLQSKRPVEIISVDSALVYRGMDIGTAKPTLACRARIPHHLIDIRDPAESYSAGDFVRDARAAIAAILAREHQPVLVGGTLLYLRALYTGLATLPPAAAGLRQQIEAQAQLHGWPALHAQLIQVDPQAAARIRPQDAQRIQRALEVFRLTGMPISHWQRATHGAREQFRWLRVALMPDDLDARRLLRERLQARFERMLQAGLVQEVAALYARGDLTDGHAAVRAVGYRQLWQMFAAGISLQEAQRQAVIATAQLAKRQLTWLRREADLRHLPMPADEGEIVGLAEALEAEILAGAGA